MIPYSELTDAILLFKLREGDERAYTEIYDRYKRRLYLHIYRRLGSAGQAEDIVHDVFSRLWFKRSEIHTSSISAYLYTAVRNAVIDFYSHQQVESAYIMSMQNFLETGEAITDHRVRARMLRELIDKEIAALPEKMRDVFEMSRKLHLSHREISEKLNISEKTVKNQVNNALKILRGRLAISLFIFILINL